MEPQVPLRKIVPAGIATLVPARRFFIWTSVVLVVLVGAELALRALGLHTPLLYETTSYGYRVRPNQDLRRFGNRVFVNSHGLRSESISPLPAEGEIRVLCVGDSITHGGAITDQAETYPYQLQKLMRASGTRVEVLNASAPGWAFANQAGWLQENGIFDSQVVVLTIGTLDLFQGRAGAEMVDGHPSFPSRAPVLASEDLVAHYLVPRLLRRTVADPGALPTAQSIEGAKINITQLLSMAEMVHRSGATPTVLFVEQPDRFEMSDPYTAAAKVLLFEALNQHRIPFVNTRDPVGRAGGTSLFRDGLHPNPRGNLILAQAAAEVIAKGMSLRGVLAPR